MSGYRAAVERFYEVYGPIAKRYGLEMHSRVSACGDGWIEIFEGEGENRRRIVRVKEAESADLYNRAAEEVLYWANQNGLKG